MKTFATKLMLLGLLLYGHLMTLPALAQQQVVITTIAGGRFPINGAQAITQNIDLPGSVVSDRAGGFYFTSRRAHTVYHVAANGVLRVIAGIGIATFSGDGGPATSAGLFFAFASDESDGSIAYAEFVGNGLAVDASGNLYITDSGNNRIRKVTPAGIITTVAGTGPYGSSGDGGPAIFAQLSFPRSVVVDAAGNLYIADNYNNKIRKVTPAGIIDTVAGTGRSNYSGDGGPASDAELFSPGDMAIDAAGNLYFVDSYNSRIRKISPSGIITTVAGGGTSDANEDGVPATSLRLYAPGGLALDAAGNLIFADTYNNRIRKITPAGIVSTVAGINAFGYTGDGSPASAARLYLPGGVALDAAGNLLIADTYNNRIRKVKADGVISTVAGKGDHFSGDGGYAIFAQLYAPSGTVVDAAGNVYFTDTYNNRIRRITPAGIITTVAGTGKAGYRGDGGPATAAELDTPTGIAFDAIGNLYFADSRNNRIRKITPAGTITTVVGNGAATFSGDGGLATSAGLYSPWGIAFDAAGNLIFADSNHHRIRRVTPAGIISTIAGSNTIGFSGDGGSATAAGLNYPFGVAVDAAGNVLFADRNNSRVRKVTPAGIISTVAGTSTPGFSGDGGLATAASLRSPAGIAVDGDGNLFIADAFNHRIRKVTPAGIISTVAGDGTYGFDGEGGSPTSAQLFNPGAVAVSAGVLFIADTLSDRILRVGPVVLTVPVLAGLSQDLGAQGATVNVTLTGTSFSNPLTIDAGDGIAINSIEATTDTFATATLTISPNADLGARALTVATGLGASAPISFIVVAPFPDLSITSSPSGNLGVGANGSFTVNIANVGQAATSGAITVTDVLPNGFTFLSGSGSGWSCSASEQTVNCANHQTLASGSSTSLTLAVAVSADAASHVVHSPEVMAGGDLISSNNTTADTTSVATLSPLLQVTSIPVAGKQSRVAVTLPAAFPMDISGVLTVSFLPQAAIPADDPDLQFETGGRTVTFTIPANSFEARFGSNPSVGPIAFQAGTVAGTLSFSGTLTAGSVQTEFLMAPQIIPRQPPTIVEARADTENGFAIVISSISPNREVSRLFLQFKVGSAVKLSCGAVAGCSISGPWLILDVKSLFDNWYMENASFGSASSLRLPLSIPGGVGGTVAVTLYNSLGSSNAVSVALP